MALPEVLFIMGPTASGKTDLAMQLYDSQSCELISVDSALVYRGMDIGTAKPSQQELTDYPHHLVDICAIDEPYSASRFRLDALPIIERAIQAGKLPVLVGGTMLYFKTLLQGIADLPSANEAFRLEINQRANSVGWPALHAELATFDPESAARIKPADSQRIQRAFEVYHLTGKTLTQFFAEQDETRLKYNVLSVAIAPTDRDQLRQRIRLRFQSMLDNGFIDEVQEILAQGYHPDLPALRSVGYRQVVEFLQGQYDQEMMVEKAITATARLAKRQMTWLRSWPDIHWLESGVENNLNSLKSLLSSNCNT
jgi:tRNA dimethylallyltransferase